MRHGLVCAAVLAAVLLPGLAGAADDTGGGESGSGVAAVKGIYGTIGGLVALDAYTLGTNVQGEPGWGLDTRIGYRFHPNFAGELQYQFVPRNELNYVGLKTDSYSSNALTANGKLFIFTGPLQPYLLLGLGFVHVSGQGTTGTNTELALRAGGGAQVLFTEHCGLYAEMTYLKPFTTLGDFNTVPIAVGALYQF